MGAVSGRISEHQRRRQEVTTLRKWPIAQGYSAPHPCSLDPYNSSRRKSQGPEAALAQLAVLSPLPSFLVHLFIWAPLSAVAG